MTALPSSCTICAAPRGDAFDLQEGRLILSCSLCTFLPWSIASGKDSSIHSIQRCQEGEGELSRRTRVTFCIGLNTLNKTFMGVE